MEKGLHFVDLTAPCKGKKLSDYRLYAIDNHPNADGNRIFSETIYDYFKRKGLLPG